MVAIVTLFRWMYFRNTSAFLRASVQALCEKNMLTSKCHSDVRRFLLTGYEVVSWPSERPPSAPCVCWWVAVAAQEDVLLPNTSPPHDGTPAPGSPGLRTPEEGTAVETWESKQNQKEENTGELGNQNYTEGSLRDSHRTRHKTQHQTATSTQNCTGLQHLRSRQKGQIPAETSCRMQQRRWPASVGPRSSALVSASVVPLSGHKTSLHLDHSVQTWRCGEDRGQCSQWKVDMTLLAYI